MTALRQRHYRFRTDALAVDGTPTWGAAEDADYDPGANNFRLRIGLSNALATATGSIPWQIYASKNGGAYAAVTTASTGGVQSVDAGASADDAAILIPRLTGLDRPAWVLENASIDLDFVSGRYYGGSLAELLSISRASDGYAKKADGTLQYFTSNQLRITDLGLLVEDSRTNMLKHSQDFSSVDGWVLNELDIATSGTAPDGTSSQIAKPSTNFATHYINIATPLSASSNTTYVLTVYAKAAGYNWLMLDLVEPSVADHYVSFNVSSGAVGTKDAAITASVETLTDGWFRCIAAITTTGTQTTIGIGFMVNNADSATPVGFTADGTSGILLWGRQLEQASFPSSYIPTGAASVARASDVVTNIGALQTDIAAAAGSVVAQIDNGMVANIAANIVDSNATNLLGFNASNNGLASLVATLITGNTANRTTQDKLGIAWNASGRSLVLNGGTVATDANAQTPSSTQHLGSSGATNFAFAYIERLTVWTSKLADAALQSLTAA